LNQILEDGSKFVCDGGEELLWKTSPTEFIASTFELDNNGKYCQPIGSQFWGNQTPRTSIDDHIRNVRKLFVENKIPQEIEDKLVLAKKFPRYVKVKWTGACTLEKVKLKLVQFKDTGCKNEFSTGISNNSLGNDKYQRDYECAGDGVTLLWYNNGRGEKPIELKNDGELPNKQCNSKDTSYERTFEAQKQKINSKTLSAAKKDKELEEAKYYYENGTIKSFYSSWDGACTTPTRINKE
jgi:hypothetical protein